MPCLLPVADLAWSRDCHDQADGWDVGIRGASGPGRHVGGRAGVMLMGGTYIGNVSGKVLISMEARLPQQMTQYVPRAHEGLTCRIAPLFNRAGIAEPAGIDQL